MQTPVDDPSRRDPDASGWQDPRVPALLEQLNAGDEQAGRDLFPLVYDELHRIAERRMAGQPAAHTLQATALVNEAYLRLCRDADRGWTDRAEFLAMASAAMRTVLIDHARRKAADKRTPPGDRVELDMLVGEYERRSGGLLALDVALEKLERRDPELARLVELRFFGGRTVEECAELLGVGERQIYRWWKVARTFLRREVQS